ncbi:unnamed protein product [Effrenium voratum]|nr:unnamed protein product [Effrenium voratum]
MLQIHWATSPRRCLDVKSGSTANRNIIQLYDCAAGTEPNQRFLTPKGQGSIRWATHPGKCLDVQGGAPEPGTKIQLFDCATDAGQTHPNQRFLMPSSGEGQIRWAAHPYLCLSVPEGLQENGAQLCLAECDEYGNHPHQQFLVPPGGYEDLCREGLELAADGPGGPLLAAAAASAALAQVPSPEAGSCAGARRLCSVAQGVGESRLWAQACDALAAGLELEAKPALETLARVAWPLPRLLSSAARPPKLPQDIPLGEQSLPGISEGSCACDMSLWLPEEARAVAAAQRVLEDINDARNTARGQGISADKIIQAMLSSSASAACRNWDSRLLTAATLVEDAWLLDDALGAEDFKAAARRLVAARSSAWDANLCLPGVVALGLVCSTREFVQNQPSHATDAARAAVACASALTGCLDMGQIVGGDGSREELEERRLAFVMDWPELAPWLLHPQRFYHEVQSPVLASDRWWRRGSENPLPWANVEEKALDIPPRRADGVAATSCAGVWEPSPDHFCHQLARGGAVAYHSDGMPRTVVLGVGLMKAGTTAVWHALAAAGNFSMGLDCEALSQAQARMGKSKGLTFALPQDIHTSFSGPWLQPALRGAPKEHLAAE